MVDISGPIAHDNMDGGSNAEVLCVTVDQSADDILFSLLLHLLPKDVQSVGEMMGDWGCSGSVWLDWSSSVIGFASMVSHLLFSSVVVDMLETSA